MKNLIQCILIPIAVLMSTTGAEEIEYVEEGGTVTLLRPTTEEKDIYVSWYFGTQSSPPIARCNYLGGTEYINGNNDREGIWQGKLTVSTNDLTIKNIQKGNFGIFICKMTVNREDTFITYKVLKLNASMSPASPLVLGENLKLACDVEATRGQSPKIHWLNPRGEEDDTNSVSRGTITKKVTNQDNGLWTCVVTNNNKENRAKISVKVMDLNPAPSGPLYTSTSSPLTIPCFFPTHTWDKIKSKGIKGVHWDFSPKLSSSKESSKVKRLFSLSVENTTWMGDQGRGLSHVPTLKNGNLSLTRNRAKEGDGGNYTCSVEFSSDITTLSRTISVEVLEIISSPGIELNSGQQLNLSCTTGHALLPDMQVKWIPPQSSSVQSLGSDHHPTHLTIPEVGLGDGGKWRCELWRNHTQLTSAMIILKIEFKLSVWMVVTICSTAVIVILICILALILHRHRQRKMRFPRQRLCQCKNPKPKGFYRT
ncbi:CD4-1 molecule [Scomber japonicus]|uniref:CD4-1 molecule n=1 Tax=Scomber japonicus TaxID=13676 RepID=UPI0023062A1E|nr:CD4-1 molecule [Scomber japonicus]